MMPTMRVPCSLIIETSVNVPAVAVTDTSPSGSTSRAPRIGVTAIAAGVGGGVLTATAGALALAGGQPAGQRASDALTIVPSAPMTISTTVSAITRARRSKFTDISHLESADLVAVPDINCHTIYVRT